MMEKSASNNLPTLRRILAKAHLRLILLTVALATIGLVASGTLVIRDYVRRNLELTAQSINYAIEPAIVFNDAEAIKEGVSSITNLESIAHIQITTPEGVKLYDWQKPAGGWQSKIETAIEKLLWPSPAISNISRNGKTLATIQIYGSSSTILNYAFSGLIIAMACLGLTIIATRILARRLQDYVIQPLEQVANVAHTVRIQRAFSERLPPSGIAEIDRFTKDFNALLAELEGWHDGLTSENAQLEWRATHDDLTKLGNRTLFAQTLNSAISDTIRFGNSLAVIYLDADGFKNINDTHGHEAGDLALSEVSRRLKSSIRTTDGAFRLGGDEFSLILTPLHDTEHLTLVTKRIEETMAQPFILPDGATIHLSMSMGISIFPDDGVSPQDLLRRADAEMYLNKQSKKQSQKAGNDHA